MKKVIEILQKIDCQSDTEESMTLSICNTFKKLSPRAAKNLLADFRDFENQTITETQFSLYLEDLGL